MTFCPRCAVGRGPAAPRPRDGRPHARRHRFGPGRDDHRRPRLHRAGHARDRRRPVLGQPRGAPTGVSLAVTAAQFPGDNWAHYGGDYVTLDASENGTFSLHIGYYTALLDTLWVKARYFDRQLWAWVQFAEVEVPVCSDEPESEPDLDADDDGVNDAVDNCQSTANPGAGEQRSRRAG
ncbi:MAG TPA: thrombospondin type 3 repeat-containing protein [Solirubrobacteraceae bacterium]|jgi:hypothetical protein